MPPANRHFVPGLVWHMSHRCHNFKSHLEWLKQDQAETSRGETIAGLSRSRSAARDLLNNENPNWVSKHNIARFGSGRFVYSLRAAYGDHFGRENEALRPNNTRFPGKQTLKQQRLSLVRLQRFLGLIAKTGRGCSQVYRTGSCGGFCFEGSDNFLSASTKTSRSSADCFARNACKAAIRRSVR
jgi:hypothetical protein